MEFAPEESGSWHLTAIWRLITRNVLVTPGATFAERTGFHDRTLPLFAFAVQPRLNGPYTNNNQPKQNYL